MSIRTAFIQPKLAVVQYPQLNLDLYCLSIIQKEKETSIEMAMRTSHINTVTLPNTFSILKKNLPSILMSECFNEMGLPFSEEVKRTEIGHLFEHILLEYLCMEKLREGARNATYTGVTDWNWKKEAHGTFHITIDTGNYEEKVFKKALNKTIEFMNYILTPHDMVN